MSEAVKNLLKEVGVDFKTEKSIELSEEKNEKMRLAEEKRKEQRRRNKEIKSKHSPSYTERLWVLIIKYCHII